MRALISLFLILFSMTVAVAAEKSLQVYLIDVEGGQATLFVTPAGESLLVDTGWGYNAYRDALRIAKVAKSAKVKKINYVVITHFHADHVGGVPQLVAKMPVETFVDHGPNREDTNGTNHLFSDYTAAIAGAKHIVAKPGDTLPLKGMTLTFVSADGNVLSSSLPGGGQPNAACEGVAKKEADPTENARSVGFAMTYEKFKTVDLGDLTWNKELELMCPTNRLGPVDVLLVSHHGSDLSGSPALVHALAPRVALIDNGAKKGGSASTWDIIKSSHGLEDIWQLHYADAAGQEHNTTDPYIANVDEADTGFYLKLTAHADGSFSVLNPRNKFNKNYPVR